MDFLHLKCLARFVELQNSRFYQISIMVPVNSLREDVMNPVCSVVQSNQFILQVIVSSQEGVLKKVSDLYEKPTKDQGCGDRGIIDMAEDVGLHLLAPRNKATVMILGYHSSGKSSFINCTLIDC